MNVIEHKEALLVRYQSTRPSCPQFVIDAIRNGHEEQWIEQLSPFFFSVAKRSPCVAMVR